MEKTTRIVGHFKETQILDQSGNPTSLQEGITITLKDSNITLEILIVPTQQKNLYIGHYTITIKEP